MTHFAFTARDRSGKQQRGVLEAATPTAVADALRGRGWLVTHIQASNQPKTNSSRQSRLFPPRSVDVEVSLQQLAVMLRGGLTLLHALSNLARQATRPSMRAVWQQVVDDIQEGSGLADAVSRHKFFPPFVVQLVKVGEQTGQLELVLDQAAQSMEQRRTLWATIFSAMMYPVIVLLAALGVTAFMVLSVIPKLQIFLKAMGKELPAMTQLVVDISQTAQIYWLHGVVGTLILTAACVAVYSCPPARLRVDRFLLRIPLLGTIFRLAGTVAFARGLGILLQSGITLLEGLRTVQRMHRNRYLGEQVATARETVMHGGSLAEPLAAGHGYMPMLGSMVAVGESAGTLDEVLFEVARFHEGQLQTAIRRMSNLIEPAITIFVGGIVGFVYISFFIALFAAGT